MEIKYTLEILTKDIQDIEKLVGQLQNSTDGSTLDLDLALSKLRNVYDVLTEIREDMLARPDVLEQAVAAKVQEKAEVKEDAVAKEEPEVMEEPEVKEEFEVQEKAPEPEEAEPKVEERAEKKAGKKEESLPKAKTKEGKGEIIAEKYTASDSLNENLAAGREADNKAQVIGQSIENISKNIGINDRFLIIRELFDGDADGFGKLIEKLDQAGNLESATSLLEIVFEHSSDHEGVSILSNLVKRRYPQS